MRKISVALSLCLLSIVGSSATSKDLEWIVAAPMSEPRLGHAMVELPAGPNALGLSTGAGKVMVIGGFDSSPNSAPEFPSTPLATCEVYDPTTDTWTPAAPHPVSGGWRWAAVLKNGMVLVAGGIKNLALNLPDSHLYDPKTDQWIETRSLPIGVTNPHGFMRSIVLPNGQVLIAGGEDDNSVETVGGTSALVHSNNAYLFTLNERHPSLSSWDYTRVKANNKISRMPEGRTTSGLVLLKDGRVLNVGGLGPAFDGLLSATNTASIFDPQTGIWSKAAPMPAVFGLEEDEIVPPYPTAPGSRWGPMAERLDNGQVLVAGGFGGVFFQFFRRSALLYDPTTNSWQMTTPTSFRRYIGSWSATLPAGAGILLAGPAFSDDYGLRNVTGEIFHPESGTWTPAPVPAGPLPPADSFESQLLRLSTGRVQIAGGINFFGPNAESGSWILREKNP